MILDRRYCPEIIAQLRAASAALKAIEAEVLRSHLRECVSSAVDSEDKIKEIMRLMF